MSSKFLTFIFIILVSVQLSSCGWGSLWGSGEKDELSTKKTTEKNFKDDELNSSPTAPIEADDGGWLQPLNSAVIGSEDLVNEDEPSSENSDQSTNTTLENVSAMPNEEFGENSEEVSSKSPNSEKDIKSIPTTSTNSTNPIVNLLFSVSTQIPDNSTLATERSESESSTTDNTNTPTTTENTLNDNDVNNVPRHADEDKEDSKGSSSVSVSSSTSSSSVETFSFENEVVSNSSEFTSPEVTYAPKDKDISISIDEEKDATSGDQQIGRKDKETHSSRDVTDKPDYSTQKITEKYESGNSSTAMTNTSTTTENTLNSTSNNEARDAIDDTENSGNSSKSETVSDLDPSASMQANTTIKTILSTSTATMNTTEMAGSMSNGTTPEVNFGSFVNSGSTGNTNSQLILNLCILIFSISVIV